MNCFNHEDRSAVAQCVDCGVFLCRECASKYNPALCDRCFRERQEEQARYVQAERHDQQMSEKKFMKTVTIFSIVGFIIGVYTCFESAKGLGQVIITLPFSIPIILIYTLLLGGIPFGWQKLSRAESAVYRFLNVIPVFGFAFYIISKFAFSIMIGWFFFLKYLIGKLFRRKK